MKKNISFFGASVTQQHNGYWYYFSEKNPHFNVKSFGYGSMHLNDAGISYIDDVLEFKPEYCFIDWFSTGYIKYNENNFSEITEYINTLLYKFYEKDVKLIFLIFPDKTVDKTEIYAKINNYLNSLNVPCIDISNTFDKNIHEILRDGIHTTPFGSKEYARLINEYFHNNEIKVPIEYPEKNKFCTVKKKNLNLIVNEYIKFKGSCEVIGISQTIGPYTGLLDLNGKIINNWDRWCYYERKMVNLKFNVDEELTIKILQDDFDRSLCDNYCDWSVKKFLNLETIYYINGNLELDEYK